MITYDKIQLKNGLTVIANRDRASRMAAVNLLYKVGARNESSTRKVWHICSSILCFVAQ